MHVDYSAGYASLRESAAWLDLSTRGKIRVSGEDRARLLHAMATQHVQQLKSGEGAYTFFLNAQGRILCDAHMFCFEDHILLDTEPETGAKLLEHLDKFIIADDVTLEDVTATLGCLAVEGPTAADVLLKLGASLPQFDHATTTWGSSRIIARVHATGAGGFRIFTPTSDMHELISQLAIPQVTADDARIVRIENGVPRYGEEISERYLVAETSQLHAVHFSKGCYLGQEIVERVRSRGQVHRVLRRVAIEGSRVPDVGTKFTAGDDAAGEIASAVYSPALGHVVALAYVRTPQSEPGTSVQVEGASARVM